MRKAEEFLEAALSVGDDAADGGAFVTLCVHAGIAASDVICCSALGVHPQGDDHQQAVRMLASVDRESASSLERLLRLKTRAGYGNEPIGTADRRRAFRAAEALLDAARARR